MRDLANNISVKRAISPVVATDNTAVVGEEIDGLGFDSVTYLISTGTLADADATFTVLLVLYRAPTATSRGRPLPWWAVAFLAFAHVDAASSFPRERPAPTAASSRPTRAATLPSGGVRPGRT